MLPVSSPVDVIGFDRLGFDRLGRVIHRAGTCYTCQERVHNSMAKHAGATLALAGLTDYQLRMYAQTETHNIPKCGVCRLAIRNKMMSLLARGVI